MKEEIERLQGIMAGNEEEIEKLRSANAELIGYIKTVEQEIERLESGVSEQEEEEEEMEMELEWEEQIPSLQERNVLLVNLGMIGPANQLDEMVEEVEILKFIKKTLYDAQTNMENMRYYHGVKTSYRNIEDLRAIRFQVNRYAIPVTFQ